jgi:transglutaminase-like putative cysteine protease
MKAATPIGTALACLLIAMMQARLHGDPTGPSRVRSFELTYHGQIIALPPGETAQVWVPVPSSDSYQCVRETSRELPGPSHLGKDPEYGNTILHFTSHADQNGRLDLTLGYRIERHELRDVLNRREDPTPATNESRFLLPDINVPIGGKPMTLLAGVALPDDPLACARVLYDVVNRNMTYAKDTPGWGRGDAVWACQSKRGNCTDFHSLFISLARTNHIPAKFEIGFSLPSDKHSGTIWGYHCWGWFKPAGHGWIPVDISEANKNPKLADYYFGNLTADRVMFSVGRDLTLAPPQAGPPINFFVYPYAEVDGKPWPAEKIKCWCEFREIDGEQE